MARIGRPLKFESLEEMSVIADQYFTGTPRNEWTITGLALALDTSRETLMEYEDRQEFVDAIRKWKEMVHNAYEIDLRKSGRSGDIFALKNFGWKDKTEQDQNINGSITINTTKYED